VPDSTVKPVDVCFGFADMPGYQSAYGRNPYFGAAIGRVANRIEKARFFLGGKEYKLAANNGVNSLHGGDKGFDKRTWESHVEGSKLIFSYASRDGEEGYPGEVLAQVTYEVTSDNELKVNYQATTTKPTPICLTNHSYFNLNGHEKGNEKLKDHFVQLNADSYTPIDDTLIPTGDISHVEKTVLDLRTEKNLGDLLASFPPGANGYDHNFVINQKQGQELNLVGSVRSPVTNISLTVYTNQPGVQFYTSNFLPDPVKNEKPLPGKGGAQYYKHGAFCLETQNFPNAINQPKFPNAVLNPGEIYKHSTIFKFTNSRK
jgi:aldose 1-epimerase